MTILELRYFFHAEALALRVGILNLSRELIFDLNNTGSLTFLQGVALIPESLQPILNAGYFDIA